MRAIDGDLSTKNGAERLRKRLQEFYSLKGHRDVVFWIEPLRLGVEYIFCVRSNIRLTR